MSDVSLFCNFRIYRSYIESAKELVTQQQKAVGHVAVYNDWQVRWVALPDIYRAESAGE